MGEGVELEMRLEEGVKIMEEVVSYEKKFGIYVSKIKNSWRLLSEGVL